VADSIKVANQLTLKYIIWGIQEGPMFMTKAFKCGRGKKEEKLVLE
jgi:hypothetical protein